MAASVEALPESELGLTVDLVSRDLKLGIGCLCRFEEGCCEGVLESAFTHSFPVAEASMHDPSMQHKEDSKHYINLLCFPRALVH